MERLGHFNGGSKFRAPASPHPGRREGGLRGSSGEGEASSRLSIWLQGAGTEAKRGPSVASSPASFLEQAGLGRGMGDSGLAWVFSGQDGNGGHLRRMGNRVFFFKVFDFFPLLK